MSVGRSTGTCSHEFLINFEHKGLLLIEGDVGHLSKMSDGGGVDV
jgi:hypothetical protein